MQHFRIFAKVTWMVACLICLTTTCLVAKSDIDVNLACNDTLHVSLNADCQAAIHPDLVLEAPSAVSTYRIIILSPMDSIGNYRNNRTANVTLLSEGVFEYAVVDESGQTCWGHLVAEDKLLPVFTDLPTDTLVKCDFELTETGIGATKPTATDNCSTPLVTFQTAYVESGEFPCDTTVIASIWKATDANGSMLVDTQRTVIIRPNRSNLILPSDIVLSCGTDQESDLDDLTKTGSIGMTTGKIVNNTFMPTDTIQFNGSTSSCGYAFNHTDIRESNDCFIKITRYWHIVDWCALSAIPEPIDTQIVQLSDTLAPVFGEHENGNLQNFKRIELSKDCRFDIVLTDPTATDDCDDAPKVEMYEVAQLNNGVWDPIGVNVATMQLTADTFRLGYRAFDLCHTQLKEDTTYTYLVTTDLTAPAVICANNLVVSIANEGGIVLDAETVDGGSFDACGLIEKHIRIKGDTLWQDAIELPCILIDSQLTVELRVRDAVGNENFCWTYVRVEDKVPPVCQNLMDQTVSCGVLNTNNFGQSTDADGDGLFDNGEWQTMTALQMVAYNETFGELSCFENASCRSFTIEQQYQRLDNGCGEAQIKRRYRGVDAQGNIGNWAEQNITATYQVDWKITFPADWEGGCNAVIPEPFIAIENNGCNSLSVNVSEKRFTADEDFCVKVERIYQVINHCLLTAASTPYSVDRITNSDGKVVDSLMIGSDSLSTESFFIYKQILTIRSTDQPNLTINAVETCLNGVHSDSIGSKESPCAELRTFTATATDCTGSNVEKYQWRFFENDSLIDTGTGASFSKFVEAAIDYSVQFTVWDACGNIAQEQQGFSFTDCVKPTLFIRTGMILELKKGEIEIWASDFDLGSHDNCTDKTTLLENFRIWHRSLGPATFILDSIKALPTNLTLNCSFLASQEVFIYAFDEADNFDVVEVFVFVQDNQESCLKNSNRQLAGQISNQDGVFIESVNVEVSGGLQTAQLTESDGHFLFDLPFGEDYTIRPTKNDQPLNGVTTFDLVLISQHILGLNPLKSPYQHIAADVNQSGTITAFDLVQLRQLILKIIPDFPNNNSWRFVDSNYKFVTKHPASEAFPEAISLEEMEKDQMNIDFVGVKIGDLNGNALTSRLSIAAEGRLQRNAFNFDVQDRLVKKGERITVPFQLSEQEVIEGLQFALDFAGMQMVGLTEGLAKEEHFNFNLLEEGQLMISWNKGVEPIDQSLLFSLTFEAKTTRLLSSLLKVNQKEMIAEAYTEKRELLALNLTFSTIKEEGSFQLMQNRPNPFDQHTTIPFYLPTKEFVSLKIMDTQGRIIYTSEGHFAEGMHEIRLDQASLGIQGILYYQLTAGEFLATKKMVVVR